MKRTPLTRRSPLKRTGRLNPVSAKKASRAADYAAARLEVRTRADGQCEARFATACEGTGTDAHHIVLRSQGGTDDPSNLAWVCRTCHQSIHEYPTQARQLGLYGRQEHPHVPA